MSTKSDMPLWGKAAMASTGVVAGAFFLVVAFSSNLPMYGDSLSEFASWAPAHAQEAHLKIAALFLVYLLVMIFSSYVTVVVGSGDGWALVLGRIALVAVAVRFGIEMMHIAVLSVATSIYATNFTGSMAVLGQQLSTFGLVPFAILLIAIGAAGVVGRTIPRWLSWFTFVVGAMHAAVISLGLTGALTDAAPVGPALAAFGTVWFTTIFAWPLVAGSALVVIAIRSRSAAARLAEIPALT